MKELLNKIAKPFKVAWAAVVAFLATVWRFIVKYWSKLMESKPMRAVGKVLGYLPSKISERLTNAQRKSIWGIIFIIPLCIGFVYFFLIPFALTFRYSISYVAKFNEKGLSCINVGINNYIFIFKEYVMNSSYTKWQSYPFWRVLLSSGLDILTELPIILIFSLIMAVVLNSKFKGRTLVRAIFFMPVIFNSQAIDIATSSRSAMSAVIDANAQNIFDTMFSFKDFLLAANLPVKFVTILSDTSTKIYQIISYSGIQILIFLSAIQSVPKHLYEAAKMEGCTAYEMFWKITFPMVSPMLLTSAVYTIVDSYTRSVMVKQIQKYSYTTEEKVTMGEGLTGKALDLYNQLKYGPGKEASWEVGSYDKLSKYGIGAGMSLFYAFMVLIIIGLVMLILSKVVFYYDE